MLVGFSLHEFLKIKNPVFSSNQSTIMTDLFLVGISLFSPRVSTLVVPIAFPETSCVIAEKLDTIHPFG